MIRFFTKRGGVALDPFVGIGSTSKACALEGRKSIGIELNPRYAELAKQRLQTEVRNLFASVNEQQILPGDARDVLKTLEKDKSLRYQSATEPSSSWNQRPTSGSGPSMRSLMNSSFTSIPRPGFVGSAMYPSLMTNGSFR